MCFPVNDRGKGSTDNKTRLAEWLQRDQTLLILGICARVLTFVFLAPFNNDYGHFANIRFIVEHRSIPLTGATNESYHPPLYYLLAAPFLYVTGSPKAVQLLSLAFSIATLVVLRDLIYRRKLIASETGRLYAFLLACFLPQFVMFGLYVSNDTLAIFLGALIVLQVFRFIEKPDLLQLSLLGLWVGLGLLTKYTFVALLPVLLALVVYVYARARRTYAETSIAILAFLGVSLLIGSYKYVQNYQQLKNPFVSNLEFNYDWVSQQQQSYPGPTAFVDVNLLRLLVSPSVSETTKGSYPLLLYGTFWYQHIPESNFGGCRRTPFKYLGSLIFVFAIPPTLVFLVGVGALLGGLPRFIKTFKPNEERERRLLVSYVALFFLLGNLSLLVMAALKYHVWSIMQSRLLFPSFFGLLAPFGFGVGVVQKQKRLSVVLKAAMETLMVLFTLYLASEMANRLLIWLLKMTGRATSG